MCGRHEVSAQNDDRPPTSLIISKHTEPTFHLMALQTAHISAVILPAHHTDDILDPQVITDN